jgi:uncharacterized protein
MRDVNDLVPLSSTASLTVWCVVGRDEADMLPFTMASLLDEPSVRHVVVVHTSPSQPECFGDLQRRWIKVQEFHQDFGEGLDKAVEEGGFNQVDARNFALGVAESLGDRWLLQFDADDYYDAPALLHRLRSLPRTVRAVQCSCYHLLDTSGYWHTDAKVRDDGPRRLINPHVRLWRNDIKRRYAKCAATASVEKNETRHCGTDLSDLIPEQVAAVAEPVHFHLHYLLGKAGARNAKRRMDLPRGAHIPPALESFAARRRNAVSKAVSPREGFVSPVSVIPHVGGSLVHFPLRGVAFFADNRTTAFVEKLRDQRSISKRDRASPEYAQFADLELVGREPDSLPTVKALRSFEPNEATLIFTESCNLSCSYCYASSVPTKNSVMPLYVAQAALDLVVDNATKREDRSCSVRYIGGGEPTLQWELLEQATNHVRQRSRAVEVGCYIRLITNGTLLSEDRVDWLGGNVDFVTLSFDILPHLQQRRSFVGGRSSHERLLRTARLLSDRGVQFHLRTTITRESAAHLVDMVWYAHQNTGATCVRFEPLSEVGRGAGNEVGKPSEDVFVEQFLAARRLGESLGIEVTCKMVQNVERRAARFCEAEFSVGPDGMVSACHRYSRPDHDNFELFRYGKFDGERFVFDLDQLNRIRGINVHTFRQCDTCFARWNCAGGCLSARTAGGVPQSEGPLCHLTRELLKATIAESFSPRLGG